MVSLLHSTLHLANADQMLDPMQISCGDLLCHTAHRLGAPCLNQLTRCLPSFAAADLIIVLFIMMSHYSTFCLNAAGNSGERRWW